MNAPPLTSLVNREVLVTVSETWDFVSACGSGPFLAQIVASGGGAVLLRLAQPPVYEGIACEYFVASPRANGTAWSRLANGEPILCALTLIPPDRAISAMPFDVSWWRGGIALLGDVVLSGRGDKMSG
jgi:hypothetical protein